MDTTWIEHRRADGERVGWIRMCADGFIAIDALGRELTGEVDWLTAEETLENCGLGFLAQRWVLDLPDGTAMPVRIVEVGPGGVRVREDIDGAANIVGAQLRDHVLEFPAPAALRGPQ